MHGICVTCSLSCCCKCAIQQIDCAAQRSEIMSAGHVQVRFNDSEHFWPPAMKARVTAKKSKSIKFVYVTLCYMGKHTKPGNHVGVLLAARYHLSTASRVAWPQPTRSGGPLSDRKTVAMSDCQLVQPSRFGGVGFSLPGVETWLVSSKVKSWRRYYSIEIVKFLGMEFRFGLFSSSLAGCFLLQSLNEIGEWDGSSYQKGARILWS